MTARNVGHWSPVRFCSCQDPKHDGMRAATKSQSPETTNYFRMHMTKAYFMGGGGLASVQSAEGPNRRWI